jgi:serine/threonine-protein kinase
VSVGPFVLGERLGDGAMGVVHLATGPDGGEVALKLLRPELAGSIVYRERFLREARVAREVAHPGLVPILDAGEADGRFYLATAYRAGGSLAARLQREGRLPAGEAVALLRQVAAGLDALHERGIVHRDVKPENVLLDGDGNAALTDFGLAKGDAYTVLTRPGEVMGTLDYIAPELIEGAAAAPAADVYALGCVAYECLTGAPPFAGKNVFEVAVAHLEEEPPAPALEPELAWAVLTALAKDPQRRPPTATAYANLLRVGAS